MRRTLPAAALAGALALVAAAAALLLAAPAAAEEPAAEVRAQVVPERFTAEERPFAWVVDPSTIERGHASLSYALGLATGDAPDRPVPVEIAPSATSHQVAVSYGLTDRIAPFVQATLIQGQKASVAGGLKVQLTPGDAPLRVALLGAGLREGASGAGGARLSLAGSYDLARLRLGATVHAEKVFASGRDAVDVMAMAGASYRVTRDLRLGVEYVGQDFEAEDAEGGARHVVGPNLALDLDRGRFQLVVAGGFGLSPRSPDAIVRAGFAGAF